MVSRSVGDKSASCAKHPSLRHPADDAWTLTSQPPAINLAARLLLDNIAYGLR
jgi:hypothetical protein